MKIKKGDNVIVRTGADAGKTGEVLRAFPADNKVIVSGVNVVKRHSKPKRTGQKGQIVDKPMPVNVSNVALVDPKTGKAARVHIEGEGKKRSRVSSKGNRIS